VTRLVQLSRDGQRRVALVDEPRLVLLQPDDSVYALARRAVMTGTPLPELVARQATGDALDYDEIYLGRSPWRLLPPIDHPHEWSRCRVSGTGLTHLGSAASRHAMHEATQGADEAQLTDSMRMFRRGVEGGRPAEGAVGAAPEWFHKGDGTALRAHGAPLEVPPHAADGGEEGEVAGAYVIGPDGAPWRVGMAQGNEFSDHVTERRNYLDLAGSKLRTCALGPELVVDPAFGSVRGTVAIERGGATLWSKAVLTGEAEMCHSLRNVEHHHFKFAHHRRPGDVHVHYYGACSLSFADGVSLADGDVMVISFDGFGRPLRNPLRADPSPDVPVVVRSLARPVA
jgi:hypothetical protein